LRPPEWNRLPPWSFAVLAVALVALWQWATVTANYRGNWTALYWTGVVQHLPPLVAAEHIYRFANSTGFDGQVFHYMAHDPSMRSDLKYYVGDPRPRYRRILIPLLAYLLACGHPGLIDSAFEPLCLLGIGLGVYWSCRFAKSAGFAAAWGLRWRSSGGT
jgi:hypothetical protein